MSALEMDDIPADFPVRPLDPAALEYRTDPETGRTVWFRATCGECGLSWDDTIPTAYTPAPSARCPFEVFHEMDEPDQDETDEVRFVVTRSAGADGAVVVMIDTGFEPDGSDGSPGLRVLLNDEPIYNAIPYRVDPSES